MARKYHRIISTLAVGGLLAAFAPGAYAASATELGTKYETLDESLWSCVWNDEFDGSSVIPPSGVIPLAVEASETTNSSIIRILPATLIYKMDVL